MKGAPFNSSSHAWRSDRLRRRGHAMNHLEMFASERRGQRPALGRGIVALATLLPICAVEFRRCQDSGLPGFIYLGLTPIACLQLLSWLPEARYFAMGAALITLILFLRSSQTSANKYGPNPQEVTP